MKRGKGGRWSDDDMQNFQNKFLTLKNLKFQGSFKLAN